MATNKMLLFTQAKCNTQLCKQMYSFSEIFRMPKKSIILFEHDLATSK